MKTYSRISRKRLQAALRLHRKPGRGPRPVELPPVELPSEIIDLASGPFRARFPELYRPRPKTNA